MDSPLSVSLNEVVVGLGSTLDLVNPSLSGHHKRVAYISGMIAQELGLEQATVNQTVLAASLHDIGAISGKFDLEVLDFEADLTFAGVNEHAQRSYRLLSDFAPLETAANIVKRHHFVWRSDQELVASGKLARPEPIEAQIIHLADRVDVELRRGSGTLDGVGEVRRKVRTYSGEMFHPDVAQAFLRLSAREGFWYRLQSKSLDEPLIPLMGEHTSVLKGMQVLDIARLFGIAVDCRSRFTAAHSTAVAEVAGELGRVMGLCDDDITLLRLSGYLHDIGKLAVPLSVLEKDGALTEDEMLVMRVHPYYTFEILDRVRGFRRIRNCASRHHERIDGSGYPFGLRGDALEVPDRILAIADVFAALSEDRPYRQGMAKEQLIETIRTMSANGRLDAELVDLACEHYVGLESLRAYAHSESVAAETRGHCSDLVG